MHLIALKRAIQKTREATGDLIWNKIADRITKKSQKCHYRVIQKQMKKKYQEEDKYFQIKESKLLMI